VMTRTQLRKLRERRGQRSEEPNLQRQFALQRAHRERLELLRRAKRKDDGDAKTIQSSNPIAH
jgi:hypothetical protein